jgi:transposase-like protein
VYSKQIQDLFRQLVLQGTPYNQIVQDLGIAHSTAFRWRKELKLGSRKTGPKGRK